jgi:RNase P protein component
VVAIGIHKGVSNEVIFARESALDMDRQRLLKALREHWTQLFKQILP